MRRCDQDFNPRCQTDIVPVDPWETLHEEYIETARVLDHFDYEINHRLGGIETPDGFKKARIVLLAGADLIQTMSTPGVWSDKDIDYILLNFGAFIIEVCLPVRSCRDLCLSPPR